MWDVDIRYIVDWLDKQDDETVAHIFAALELLQQRGPGLGRPLVDTLKHSAVSHLKELRPASPGSTEVRILFAFDPTRKAIMLLGGDKSKGKRGRLRWAGWYKRAIPEAEKRWVQHLGQLEEKDD